MIVFYHNRDLDGLCAGAILHRRYPDAELYGIDYGDPFPWDKVAPGHTAIMVDFSLQPFTDMVKLSESCRLLWLDHHKSALNDAMLAGAAFKAEEQHTDAALAGCELAWKFSWPNETTPKGVRLLGRYDIWAKQSEFDWDKEVLPFQYGMKAKMPDPKDEFWDLLLGSKQDMSPQVVQIVRSNGNVIMEYLTTDNKFVMNKLAFDAWLMTPTKVGNRDQFRCLCLNRMPCSSQTFESQWDPAKYHMMCAFSWGGEFWTVSLYSTRDDIDCSAIAKTFWGGGHAGAAGFQWHGYSLPLTPC